MPGYQGRAECHLILGAYECVCVLRVMRKATSVVVGIPFAPHLGSNAIPKWGIGSAGSYRRVRFLD
jgi:hypothetical protein